METFIITSHFIFAIVMIILVLIQAGKGASIGATFGGGGSQTLFGPRGAGTFLTKATTVLAVAFLATSICLAQMSKDKSTGSVLDKVDVDTAVEDVVVPEEETPAEEKK